MSVDFHNLVLKPKRNVRGAGMDVLQDEPVLRIEDVDGNNLFQIDAQGNLTGSAAGAVTGGDMLNSQNLSGLTNVAAARTNLGLGTAATLSSTAFAAASHTHAISAVTGLQTQLDNLVTTSAFLGGLDLKADKDSPAFTGTPTAPTALPGTNSTQLATTAFVTAAVAAGGGGGGGDVTLTGEQTLTNKTLTAPVIDGGATFTKTGFGAGISNAFAFTITGAALAADYPFGIRIDLTNTGTATPDLGRHGAALLGNAQDVAASKTPLIGVEGKVQGFGTACSAYTAVVGDALFTGSTFAGTLAAFSVSRGNITSNGTTALNEGINVGYYCYELLGGARKFGVLSREEIAGWGTNVRAYAADLTKYYGFYHDGTNGLLSTNSGGMIFDSGPSAYVLMGSNSLAFAPLVTGSNLGIATNRWTAALASGSYIGLAASVTPANNGDLMFQATSNTSVTLKYKGSDGVVRSASLTMS